MAVYAAVSNLKNQMALCKDHFDLLLPPPYMKVVEIMFKGSTSIQEFVERLDSHSRKRMSASLAKMAEEIRTINDRLFKDYVCSEDGMQRLKQVFTEILKKVEDLNQEFVPTSRNKSTMVGLSDVFAKLKQDLVGDWVTARVFYLFGMTGIGKTTLAREIYQDLDISEWFDCLAWVTLGRESTLETIARAVLGQVDPDAQTGGPEEIVEYMKEVLSHKRFLLVLDDVWDERALYDLKTSFSCGSGSRILLTTRIRLLEEPGFLSSHRLETRLLTNEESWDLLRSKVFAQDSCPLELEKAGKKIAEKCDGLPLTIVIVADLLSKDDRAPELLWIEVASQKKHQLFTDAYNEIAKVFQPIYDNLVEDFKSCFLYMGVFLQKHEIPKSKIINLWIAEGIVELMQSETLEDSAKSCLQHLAVFSFVMMYQISDSSYGLGIENVKTCGLHSSWWHFCQREARKSNFFYVLDCYNDDLVGNIKGQMRLSIHNNVLFGINDVRTSMEEYCASTAHSLLCFGPYHQFQVPMCFGLKLLQKLDALNIRFYEFPLEVLELVELRYLALTCNGMLPPSISKLFKLKFLIIGGHFKIKSHGRLSYLPAEIWDIMELKYLQVMGYDLLGVGDSSVPNLLTLSGVSNDSCTKGVFGRIPNLKKLGIQIELVPDAAKAEPLCCLDHISSLRGLKSLTCVIVNPRSMSVPPLVPLSKFPRYLRKLNLSGLGYPWEEINKFASLPYLFDLKLKCNAFCCPFWRVEDDGFPELHFLLLEDLDVVQLFGLYGSLRRLKCITIKHCYKLKDLCLRSFMNVEKIKVVDSNPSLIKEIQDSVLDRSQQLEQFCVHASWDS